MEESEKAGSRRESNPGLLWLEPSVLCHWAMTARQPPVLTVLANKYLTAKLNYYTVGLWTFNYGLGPASVSSSPLQSHLRPTVLTITHPSNRKLSGSDLPSDEENDRAGTTKLVFSHKVNFHKINLWKGQFTFHLINFSIDILCR